MPDSTGNPLLLTLRNLPASGQPRTRHNGLELEEPLMKQNLTGAVRRDRQVIAFNAGATMAGSTTYNGMILLPARPALITGIWLALGVAPTVATSTLTITANGVTLLSAANFSVSSATPINVLNSLSLSVAAALGANVSPGLPYLTAVNQYSILCTYAEGATTVKSSNVNLLFEFELDDFNG